MTVSRKFVEYATIIRMQLEKICYAIRYILFHVNLSTATPS